MGEERKGKGKPKKASLAVFLSISVLVRFAKSASQAPSMIPTKALLDDYLRVELFTQSKYELVRTSVSIIDGKSCKLKVFL